MLSKQAFWKLYICIAERKKTFSGPDHFRFSVGYQKSWLKESNLFQLILEQKAYYNHLKDIHMRLVNLLSSDISLLDIEAKFCGISGVHYNDFAPIIRAAIVIMIIMTIVTILVIKTVKGDKTILIIVIMVQFVTFVIIVTVVAIKTVIAIITFMVSSRSFQT